VVDNTRSFHETQFGLLNLISISYIDMLWSPRSRFYIICLLLTLAVSTTAQNVTKATNKTGSVFSFMGLVQSQSTEFVRNLTQPLTDAINSINITSINDLTSNIIDVSVLKSYKEGLMNSTMVLMIRSLIDAVFGDKSNSTNAEQIRRELR
jgi:hypothetical protein